MGMEVGKRMGDIRRQHTGAFKTQVAVAAIRGERTMSELSGEFGIHPTVINRWKKQVLDVIPKILSGKTGPVDKNQEELISRLYQEIGQLKVELDWLKKKSGL
jgi:putative transposase